MDASISVPDANGGNRRDAFTEDLIEWAAFAAVILRCSVELDYAACSARADAIALLEIADARALMRRL